MSYAGFRPAAEVLLFRQKYPKPFAPVVRLISCASRKNHVCRKSNSSVYLRHPRLEQRDLLPGFFLAMLGRSRSRVKGKTLTKLNQYSIWSCPQVMPLNWLLHPGNEHGYTWSSNLDRPIHASIDDGIPNLFNRLPRLLVHKERRASSMRATKEVVTHVLPGLRDLRPAPTWNLML
jgi:hypothetical protein